MISRMMRGTFALFTLCVCLVLTGQENRTYDGFGNNVDQPDWGSAGSSFRYFVPAQFADGIGAPTGMDRPNPREVSNLIFGQNEFIPNERGVSDFGWNFGQFIDHETTLNFDNKTEFLPIPVPTCDPMFDPMCTGQVIIPFRRSGTQDDSGISPDSPRLFKNELTAFIDASAVYGVTQERADWLRTFEGGRLKVSEGNLLPYNTLDGEYASEVDEAAPEMIIDGPPPARHFIAGDERANEQPGLTCMHTLFVREHNRLCSELILQNPDWSDEELFQEARRFVAAYIQVILEKEFLPALGIQLPIYDAYDPSVDAGIMNIFSAAAYRLGHTLVNDQLVRLTDVGDTLNFGSLHVKDAFFNTDFIRLQGGLDPIFKGMATQKQQTYDTKVVNTLRNFLFGPPGAGGLDLVSINVQRGRERGLCHYNDARVAFGLESFESIEAISDNIEQTTAIEAVYGDIEKVDLWVGMLSETPEPNAAIGELALAILEKQFLNIRNGDRFWYLNDPAFSLAEKEAIGATKMSDLIRRNTGITNIQDEVFFAEEHHLTAIEMIPFDNIRTIEINAYPNPVISNINLFVKTKAPEVGFLTVNDLAGKELFKQKVSLVQGENRFEYVLPEAISAGLYLIKYASESGAGSLTIVKQ